MNSTKADFDAIFIGWQKKSSADIFPLFDITAEDHPLYQSTVSEATLRKLQTLNTSRTKKIRASVLQLHDLGRGADLARGTVWGAFNSVAEYTNHMMSDEDSDTRLNSIWFGRGEQLKVKAFCLAEQLMRN